MGRADALRKKRHRQNIRFDLCAKWNACYVLRAERRRSLPEEKGAPNACGKSINRKLHCHLRQHTLVKWKLKRFPHRRRWWARKRARVHPVRKSSRVWSWNNTNRYVCPPRPHRRVSSRSFLSDVCENSLSDTSGNNARRAQLRWCSSSPTRAIVLNDFINAPYGTHDVLFRSQTLTRTEFINTVHILYNFSSANCMERSDDDNKHQQPTHTDARVARTWNSLMAIRTTETENN